MPTTSKPTAAAARGTCTALPMWSFLQVSHLRDASQMQIWSVQIVPKGRKWTSAFKSCAGGYLKSNHIGLLGLVRFGKSPQPSMPIDLTSGIDWATAVNIRMQRCRDTLDNILASDRHGPFQLP